MRPRRRDHFSPAQVRAARGLLGWTQERLAAVSDVDPLAIARFEGVRGELSEYQAERVGAALNEAGIIAIQAAHAGAGVRFKKPQTR